MFHEAKRVTYRVSIEQFCKKRKKICSINILGGKESLTTSPKDCPSAAVQTRTSLEACLGTGLFGRKCVFVRRFNPQNPMSFSFYSKQRNTYVYVVTWHHRVIVHTFPVRTTTGPSPREWREKVNIPRERN